MQSYKALSSIEQQAIEWTDPRKRRKGDGLGGDKCKKMTEAVSRSLLMSCQVFILLQERAVYMAEKETQRLEREAKKAEREGIRKVKVRSK